MNKIYIYIKERLKKVFHLNINVNFINKNAEFCSQTRSKTKKTFYFIGTTIIIYHDPPAKKVPIFWGQKMLYLNFQTQVLRKLLKKQ